MVLSAHICLFPPPRQSGLLLSSTRTRRTDNSGVIESVQAGIHYLPSATCSAEQAAKAGQQLNSFVANEQNGASAVSFTSDERSFIIDMGASITIYQMTF